MRKYERERVCCDLARRRAQAIRAVRALTEKVLSSSQIKRQSELQNVILCIQSKSSELNFTPRKAGKS